jgi:pyruvate/2-oxoglutarate dehydrogenase complex dihydrolipoamide acyltransferase (E2) component
VYGCPKDADDESRWVDVFVPPLGVAVSTIVLVAWCVEPSARTTKGEPLFQLGTEKTVFDVDAEVDGVLAEVLAQSGESVRPWMVVGRIRRL